MGKIKDLLKKIRDIKEIFHAKMDTIKDRNCMNLMETEDIKKRWQQYTDANANANAKSLQSCPTLCDPIDGPTRLPRPWDSPGKNTGVGCHFLLQCMKVKSESEVAQSCPTLRDPMDCSLPGSSVRGIFQARVLEWGATIHRRTTQYLHDPDNHGGMITHLEPDILEGKVKGP